MKIQIQTQKIQLEIQTLIRKFATISGCKEKPYENIFGMTTPQFNQPVFTRDLSLMKMSAVIKQGHWAVQDMKPKLLEIE